MELIIIVFSLFNFFDTKNMDLNIDSNIKLEMEKDEKINNLSIKLEDIVHEVIAPPPFDDSSSNIEESYPDIVAVYLTLKLDSKEEEIVLYQLAKPQITDLNIKSKTWNNYIITLNEVDSQLNYVEINVKYLK